ncbi:MAG: transketolase [Pseudomonadota bacterium]
MTQTNKAARMAHAIRFLSADAVQKANSGHPGLPMGAADIATVLFTRFMKFDPKTPDWADRDRFVLSAGHGSMLLYSALYLLGYPDIGMDEIKNFRQVGSKTAGHPEYGHAAGIETTTGPLGQGIGNAVGMAMAEKHLAAEFGDDLVNHRTYCLVGDGCLMEGISQEAISLAGHLKLNKLIVLWDNNSITIDGAVSLADSTNQRARFEASGWNVLECDGHDHEAIADAITAAQKADKPTMIACETTIGYGAPNKAGTKGSHGSPLGPDELAATREALGWEAEPFDVPEDILDAWRIAGLRTAQKHKEWKARLKEADDTLSGEFVRRQRGELPAEFEGAMADHLKDLAETGPSKATRKASQATLEVINGAVPETLGGSADLTGSNNTDTTQTKPITPDDFSGRFIHYGIREHGMAAMMNGMALHGGVIPYSGGFLVFSDYCRPSIRLAALMGIRVIHVMTHDSIGLGEDGPTHQPVEHLAALRAIPGLNVFRPADVNETAECWQLALESADKPSVLALTRQDLAPVRSEYSEKNRCAKGAYVVADSEDDAVVSLFASGSEVGLALDAKEKLDDAGHPTRVVSVPSFELFAAQSDSYRRSTIGDAKVKIGIEAAVRQGWDAIIGSDAGFIGMTGFGASGPGDALFEHFGITPEAVVEMATARLSADS